MLVKSLRVTGLVTLDRRGISEAEAGLKII